MNEVGKALRETATLVVFTSRMWGARALDRSVVDQVAEENEAQTKEVGTFTKKLLAGADEEFKELCAKIREARQVHYAMTLPYTKGQALLPNAHMLEYVKRMAAFKREISELKQKFKEVYPERKQQAMEKLGKLADPSKYPPVDAIDSTFGIEFEFLPVPDASDFSYLPEGFAKQLGESLEEKLQERARQAETMGWKRLYDTLSHGADKCLDPDTKRFFQSMVDHIRDSAEVMKAYVQDANRKAICERALVTCEGVTKDKLRDNLEFRRQFGESCKQIMGQMEQLGLVDNEEGA